ncbi:DUF7289 family protein [Methanofollis ethanolicus]|uniref:DUF7289 family protein n=1 Tax=Methanofollis ethanolicus TaxID=488124 RepID=UPI0008350E10|nr:hypothetical protein [Methanofollis ethanolicus]
MHSPQDEDALSEVVGFVLLLGVLVLALSVYLLYAVPAEGRENEITHMNMVKDRFTDYKIALDSLWVNEKSGVLLSTAFDLGTGAAATEGGGFALPILSPVGSGGSVAVKGDGAALTITAGEKEATIPLGSLTYTSSNNYWVDQTWTYQMGAVFLSQEGGTTVRVGPSIAVARARENITLTITPISLNGSAKIGGSGPARIETRMRGSDPSSLDGTYDRVDLVVMTKDMETAWAWERAFKEVQQRARAEGVDPLQCLPGLSEDGATLMIQPQEGKKVILKLYPANYTVTIHNAASLME